LKRDMDLIRDLLLKLEALPVRPGGVVTITPDAEEIAVPGYDRAQIAYHLSQIRGAGLIDNGGVNTLTGNGFRSLTWAGHDFLDAVRDPEIWARRKRARRRSRGSLSISFETWLRVS